MTEHRKGPVPWIIPAVLIAASAVSIMSTDLYTPSLPHLPAYFGTDATMVQLTLGLNFLAFALAQPVYGPLADRFGRRIVLRLGLVAFTLTALACAVAWSIESLIAARVLMGVAAATEAVVALAVIRDLYDEEGSVRVFGAYGMAVALAPAVAPIIGGFMHVWLGWRANFLLLAGLCLMVTVLVWRILPETGTRDPGALRPGAVLRGYGALLRNRAFLAYGGVVSVSLAGFFAFITAGPFLLIDRLGVRTEIYGLYYAAIVLAYFCGSTGANRAAGRASTEAILIAGLALLAVAGALTPALLVLDLETPWTLTGAVSIYAAGMGLLMPTTSARALAAAPASASAAALLGMMQVGCGGLGAMSVGIFHDGTSRPFAATLAVACLLATLGYLAARAAGGARPATAG